MYQNLLVPIDGSTCSQYTVHWALAFAKKLQAQLTFMHIIENPIHRAYALPGETLYLDIVPKLKRAGEALLENAKAEAARQGVSCETHLTEADHPSDGILANEKPFDLIIMGSHSREGLERLFLGSVTEAVLRRSSKQHVILPCPEAWTPEQGLAVAFAQVLAPLDNNPCSEQLTAETLKFVKALGAEVTFLHVASQRDHSGASLVEQASMQAEAMGVAAAQKVVEKGNDEKVAEAIIRLQAGFDVAVMATHGRRGLSRTLLGSVTEGVLRHASIPHLVLRCT